jgi:hypothetical protein
MTRHRRGEPAVDSVTDDDLIDGPRGPVGPRTLTEEELSAIWRAKLMFRVLVVVGAVFLLTVVTLLVVGVWVIRGTQLHNTKLTESTHQLAADTHRTAEQTKHTSDLIQSCVDRTGDCYKQTHKQTRDAVGTLAQSSVLSASCAAHLVIAGASYGRTEAELTALISACVARQLAHPSPTPPTGATP